MNINSDTRKLAHIDYLNKMKYKEIAEKYKVSINTVKSWKKRYNWQRDTASLPQFAPEIEEMQPDSQLEQQNPLRELIKNDLLNQLKNNGTFGSHFKDLVCDYMSMWDIKNMLIDDISRRGVVVKWSNGKQSGEKKNESINELNKTNAQMLKILAELELRASKFDKDDDDAEDV
ncbi:P27 family phage terminase small subunit [Alkalihalobacillus sp. LMS39]|uniref:P27 family phage terminase small subunit n=1 Tax=Alkalihalobacillus sp. LMS39 TaxID=2924032 RepID=UPI001FB50961|nr:P27 family phage terminase small subunit [Alkalihalobacillus sp. LMS39]UOE96066.1 helix-turn-helix domain-containing protein [Alkalihalobacillus sp. LMS39]